jgi:hypothetical protein
MQCSSAKVVDLLRALRWEALFCGMRVGLRVRLFRWGFLGARVMWHVWVLGINFLFLAHRVQSVSLPL